MAGGLPGTGKIRGGNSLKWSRIEGADIMKEGIEQRRIGIRYERKLQSQIPCRGVGKPSYVLRNERRFNRDGR
jgi:hypothetical protein